MKKIVTLFTMLLLSIASTWAEDYIPVRRVTSFESGKHYMLYNTAFNGSENRTGFIYVNNGMKKWTGANRNPREFFSDDNAYLWNVTVGDANLLSLQNVSTGKYYGVGFGAFDSNPNNLYLYQWGSLTGKQAGVSSENEDRPSQKTANANITFAGNKVFLIGGASDGTVFWNGNPGDIVTWTSGHPFAFYETASASDVAAEVMSEAYVGTYAFQANTLTTGASTCTIAKADNGDVTISPNSGSFGPTSGRFVGTLVVKINLPETTTAGVLCDMRQASGNPTNSQGLYMDADRVLKPCWSGGGRTGSTTLDAGEHTIVYTTGEDGARVFVDGEQKIADSGLKASGFNCKAIYIPAAYASYVTEVYFWGTEQWPNYVAAITKYFYDKHMHASQQSGTTVNVPTGMTLIMDKAVNWTSLTGTGTVTVPEVVTATVASIANTATLTGAGNLVLGTFPTSSAPNVTGWTGTVQLPEAGGKGNLTAIFNAWGNANSTIQLNSVTGYFNESQTVNPTLDILSGATVTVNNGSSNNTPVLAKVTGAGTLAQTWSGGSGGYTLKIATLTGFTGTLRGTNKPIAVDKLVLASEPASDSETLLISKSGTVTLTNIYVGTEDITGGVTKEIRDDGIYSTAYDPVAAKAAVAMSILQPYINANAIGTGIGQYTVTMVDGGTVLRNLAEIQTDINSRTTLADWENVHITVTINQPQVGHTYAFKGAADSHQYMIGQSSTVADKTNRLALTATPTGNSHVFTLLEGNKLQSYTSGKYLVSTDENTKGYLNVGDEANAVSFEFVASESQIGAYQLKYTYNTYVRTVWSMQTGYVDGGDFPQSAIGYQWIIEEVEPKTTSNITYQITEGGTVKWEETIEAGIGDTYPAPTFSHPFVSALAGVPDGIVQDHDETFPLTYTTKYDIFPDVSNITKYYALDIHATQANYPMYSDGQALRKETTNIDLSKYAQGSADYIYAWAFVGNIFDGIKLYNMEDQKYVRQPADDRNTHVLMTSDPDEATAFTVYPNVDVATAFSLKKSEFSNYLNQLNGYVGGWTSADGGSAIRAYPISEFTDSTAHLFDRMKNTTKFDLVEGAVVVSPDEYDAPSEINAAIDAANALSEPVTRIKKKNFINTRQGQKLYNFLVQSDHYGDPVVVTYVQNRPYGTLILPLNFACPDGWTRYYCSELTEGGRLVLTDFSSLGIEETKNRPFIIYSPETIGTTYQFIGYSGGASDQDVTIGLLTGVLSDGGSLGGSLVPKGSYVLAYQKSTGLQSFRKTDGFVVCPQYKVYLTKPESAESRDNFYFPDVDDSATGLEELLEQSVLADGKYVRDGRVIIVKNGVKYNTNGQIIK